MKAGLIGAAILIALVFALLGYQSHQEAQRELRDVQRLQQQVRQLLEEPRDSGWDQLERQVVALEATVEGLITQLDRAPSGADPSSSQDEGIAQQLQTLAAELEALRDGMVQEREQGDRARAEAITPFLRTVPQGGVAHAQPHVTGRGNNPDALRWDVDQALGPPDTETAGDLPTAWASRDPF